MMEFPERLKQLRLDKGYSQTALANELYVTRQAISKWERGLGKPDHETLKQISCFFNISIDNLLSDSVDLEPNLEPISTGVVLEQALPLNTIAEETYITEPVEKESTLSSPSLKDRLNIRLKSLDSHFMMMSLISLFPIVIHPSTLLLSFPIMLLAYLYNKKRVYYALAIIASLLLVSLETYGYFGAKFGWFTNYEVILLDEDLENIQTDEPSEDENISK
ncbi:helix-turn-helix domain-containing protein [Marinilactibacillus sp. Marseille-P9653]|uniref:helix-turn-helix domain-containing protein n=1 Tax=Marinilactibacillus sp. Marseille-P9653 TaxID=2866583 RepID=UPI001CE4296E|nr:helix-turn-helix transcriptional regulator [Marinilactibacillus sp. Marseille-P9653]